VSKPVFTPQVKARLIALRQTYKAIQAMDMAVFVELAALLGEPKPNEGRFDDAAINFLNSEMSPKEYFQGEQELRAREFGPDHVWPWEA
jgi:hypothetical protein